MPVDSLDVEVTNVEINGKVAEATVSMNLKDAKGAPPMVMRYRLEQQNGKWAVVSRVDAPGSPHGGSAAPPPAANPHGGAPMPSPEDLPPAGTKK